ncbi:unnamed protein product, partial [Taenia asiatica]|uniref:ATPase n=1 Tax=Taenia asiatica TaxID=60517 RepID=A0A0R3WGI9_TAEAS
MSQVSKLSKILMRAMDRLKELENLYQAVKSRAPNRIRIYIQPLLSFMAFHLALDRFGVRKVVVDFEADQLAAALAIYLDAPLVSPRAYEGGFYIEAQQFVGREGP